MVRDQTLTTTVRAPIDTIAVIEFSYLKGFKMQKHRQIGLIILAHLSMSVSPALSDTIPWGYSAADGQIFNNAAKTSSITFHGASGVATGDSGIVIYNMRSESAAGSASPDTFAQVPFDLAFTLVDIKATGSASASARTTDLIHVTGKYSATNVTRQSLLPGASPWPSPIMAQTVLGGDDVGWRSYTVMLSSFTSPGQPGGSPGSIQAIVTIADVNPPVGNGEPPPTQSDPPPVGAAPEPASLVMAIFTLPFVALIRKRRRRMAATSTE